jgi:peptidoglycan/xylan/chitin deacetylase (PgdA/CDA1 family)
MNVEIVVAVIARPDSPTLDLCVSALRDAGALPDIVEIGGDGAAMARNRALAACQGEVLALVEDDVAVDTGWLRALHDGWHRVPDDLAVVGGPLRVGFVGERPGWFGSGLDAALTALDLGDAALDLDLAGRTLHGGNVSFRADALRGVGAFWPARGHADGRDWFSDEHHAQHALAAHGWRGRYEPGLAAVRLVLAAKLRLADLLRRRLRYGARMAAAGGGRSPNVAARALASGVTGALLARDSAKRAQRAARAAENLGVVAGGPLVARDFEPVATRTQFRTSVPPPRRRRRRARRSGALVLLYHRVADEPRDPLRLCVAPHTFEQHLDVLVARRRVVALDELVVEREPGTVAITFDDGYADNAETAAPMLAARALPWTLFASTGHIEERYPFWWDQLTQLFTAAPPGSDAAELRLMLPGGPRAWRTATVQARERARAAVLEALQALDADAIADTLKALRVWAKEPRRDGEPAPMTVGAVRELAHAGVAIGAHTRTHRGLAYASPAEQRDEVRRSRADLKAWLGQDPSAFAYPFGIPNADVDSTTIAIVREAGFRCAFVNTAGLVTRHSDTFAIPRAAVPPLGADMFAGWLAQQRR